MKKNPKDLSFKIIIIIIIIITDMMMLDQVRNEEKEPKPDTGGHDRPFQK